MKVPLKPKVWPRVDSNLQPHLCTQKQEIKRQINKMQFCFFADQSEELILKLPGLSNQCDM